MKLLSARRKQRILESITSRQDAFRLRISGHKPILFIDAGANIGQGYRWFSSIYRSRNVHFELFEPNPNCLIELDKKISNDPRVIAINADAIATKNGQTKLLGTADSLGGALSQGGSIEVWHNTDSYDPLSEEGLWVSTIDFGEYLETQSKKFAKIVVKMDIEGSELDCLEDLIAKGRHRLIDTIYVEFHSDYAKPKLRKKLLEREARICTQLQEDGVRLRLWH